jgi:hypothetical protein
MNLTTSQLEADALTVPCPEHHVSEGRECPQVSGEDERTSVACFTRHALASARRQLAEFPRGDDLDGLNWGQMRQLAFTMRDAAQDASNCVDIALADFGVA